jgi:hypothetical protein
MVDESIKSVSYTMLPSGKHMICEIVMNNGFSVIGSNATVSEETFNIEMGKNYSYKAAIDKVWELQGFLLSELLMAADDFK